MDAALFPPRYWAAANARAGRPLVLPAASRSLLVHARAGAGGVLFAEPPLPPAQQHNEVEKVILGLETKAGAAPRDEDQVRPFLSLRFWT